MNAKHTPGPWRIGDAGNTIFGPKGESPSPVTICSIGRAGGDIESARRNARLIASAPELLDALERLVEDYERVKRFAHDNGLQWVGSSQAPDWQARQVIAKARGQS